MTTKEQLSVKTVNNLAKQYGHWPEVFAGHQPYVNFTVKELHAFVEAVSAALAEKAGEVAGLAVATHAGADTVAVVVNLLKDGITTVLYSENHSLNGETYGVADIPADLIPTPSAQPAPVVAVGAVMPCEDFGTDLYTVNKKVALDVNEQDSFEQWYRSKAGSYPYAHAGWMAQAALAATAAPVLSAISRKLDAMESCDYKGDEVIRAIRTLISTTPHKE